VNKLIKIVVIMLQPKIFKKLLSMNSSGYLNDIGWINAFKKDMPIDQNGNPLPWVTYSFIDFISNRINTTMDIFEYGSGNSTLWYSNKVNSVTSVEHDKDWFKEMNKGLPANVNINYEELVNGGKYSNYPNLLTKKFDIVIVDGRDRVNCMKNSINSVKDNGVIVLDDSERETYNEGIDFLLAEKYKKIDFWGISPGLFYKKCTTLFYKNNNCLDI